MSPSPTAASAERCHTAARAWSQQQQQQQPFSSTPCMVIPLQGSHASRLASSVSATAAVAAAAAPPRQPEAAIAAAPLAWATQQRLGSTVEGRAGPLGGWGAVGATLLGGRTPLMQQLQRIGGFGAERVAGPAVAAGQWRGATQLSRVRSEKKEGTPWMWSG